MANENIPYKIYLNEDEMPRTWYNVRADMKVKPAPLRNPATGAPMSFDDLRPVFCDELIRQELDNDDREIPIPDEIRDFYKMYRPSPLVRAYCLEKQLQTPAKIYYKFEGNAPKYISKDLKATTPPARTSSTPPSRRRTMPNSRGCAASRPRPAPVSGARRCRWPAPIWVSTARSTWSSARMSRSPSAAR